MEERSRRKSEGKQKHALVGIYEGTTMTFEQEGAAEGMLNLLDFLQDSIVELGLATEDEIFPKLPQLFDELPTSAPVSTQTMRPQCPESAKGGSYGSGSYSHCDERICDL